MARIIPKLNLNKTPQAVDNYSMVFAKNIRLLKDGTLGRDCGADYIEQSSTSGTKDENATSDTLVGYISYNRKVYLFYYKEAVEADEEQGIEASAAVSSIYRYDEDTEAFIKINSAWTWGHGVISGYANINLRNETLLTVIESDVPDGYDLVPIKTINLAECSANDDESIYTQTPNIPIVNFNLAGSYMSIIPNGTYQFFVRYEIKDNLYTNWIPVSKELSTANIFENDTYQGTVRYIKTTQDSNMSFVFKVENINSFSCAYKAMQVGFILSHDDSVVARSWKKFSLDTTMIYFDYDKDYIEEIDITDLLDSVFGLYNIGNVTAFKNKLYISNYKETDYNEDLQSFADLWKVNISNSSFVESLGYTYLGLDCTVGELYPVEEEEDKKVKALTSVEGLSVSNYFDVSRVKKQSYLNSDYFSITRVHESTTEETVDLELTFTKLSDLYNYAATKGAKSVNGDYTVIDKYNIDAINHGELATDTEGLWTENPTSTSPFIKEICDTLSTHILGFNITKQYAVYNMLDNLIWTDDGIVVYYHRQEVKWSSIDTDLYTGKIVYTNCVDTYTITLKENGLLQKGDLEAVNQQTLIPYQKYKFFIHYIKQNGIVTNGYPISDNDGNYEVTIPYYSGTTSCKSHCIIAPWFRRTDYENPSANPSGYIGFFFSIAKTGNTVSEIINPRNNFKSKTYANCTYGDCLDIDTLQIPLNKNIKCFLGAAKAYNLTDHYVGEYIDSGRSDSDDLLCFGASGVVRIATTTSEGGDAQFFIMNENEKNEDNIILNKCTKYFDIDTIFETGLQTAANLYGYICTVSKPIQHEDDSYVSGSDVYVKDIAEDDTSGAYLSITSKTSACENNHLSTKYVYSNFNLNFLELTNDISKQFRSWTVGSTTNKQLLSSFNSLTFSDLYTFPSMYKNITRKQYAKYDKNAVTEFNNTIRRSSLESDEAKTYIYTFKVDDTYNVPTNKGYITNLVGVGDVILVHTEDSIFKFTGKVNLTNDSNNVQTTESDVFDTGCAEITSSAYGFAGLRNKEYAMVCQYGYIFWDTDANVIYIYSGDGQLAAISDPIEKILMNHSPVDIRFACDYYNNRFFINITFADGDCATLSYNTLAKSIISLHDFTFNFTFNTKTGVYFIKKNSIENTRGGKLFKLNLDSYTYGSNNQYLTFNDSIYPYKYKEENKIPYAIVDIIFNDNYETIKTLNYISWICNAINEYIEHYDPSATTINLMNLAEEELNGQYAGNEVTIYSDTCATKELDITSVSNVKALYKKKNSDTDYSEVDEADRPKIQNTTFGSEAYKLPRYNLGKWFLNYFRNIRNSTNVVKTPTNVQGYNQDLQSLMYGKYFVVRFLFDPTTNFKLENIEINTNTNTYGNI